MRPFVNLRVLDAIGVKIVLGVTIALLSLLTFGNFVSAQLSISVTTPDGKTLEVTGRNMARGDEALIVYDKGFGKTTRTNPYGVEVTIEPDARGLGVYSVTKISSIWDCQKNNTVDSCNNVDIPASGYVLSATGTKRDTLKTLKPGDVVRIEENWFQQRSSAVSITNPSPLNNPGASGFPGYRGSNQLIVYDANYGQPTTGTNEFGFEVTVENNRVVAQEGSDSAIPNDTMGNSFVLSGHGKGRSWLIANAPIGAKVFLSPGGREVTSTIDFDTYQYQFDQKWKASPCGQGLFGSNDAACRRIAAQRDRAVQLNMQGTPNLAVQEMIAALDQVIRHTWSTYPAFPNTAVKGVWHRPVEKNRVEIGRKLDMLKNAGLNAVFLETYFHGYTIFPSETFKAYGLPAQNPKFAGEDLLRLWTEEAHKRKMTVHVWFQTFYAGTKAYNPPGPVLAKYPAWANVQYAALVDKNPKPAAAKPEAKLVVGAKPAVKPAATVKPGMPLAAPQAPAPPPLPSTLKDSPKTPVSSNLELGAFFLDPANPEVRTFVHKLALEIVTRYDVDGFQLDYIRYPGAFPPDRWSYHRTTWGYTPVARNEFKAKYHVDPIDIDPKKPEDATVWQAWNDYKTAKVTSFVQEVTADIHKQKPGVKISAAIFPEAQAALQNKHQDWGDWARRGWLDFLAPMTLTSAIKVVDHDTRYLVGVTNGKVPVNSGIFGPFNDNSADHVLSQIEAARKAGATGFVLFDSAHLTGPMLEALKLTQNRPAPAK